MPDDVNFSYYRKEEQNQNSHNEIELKDGRITPYRSAQPVRRFGMQRTVLPASSFWLQRNLYLSRMVVE